MIKARLSFNTNNWLKPSGLIGKSKSKSTFECLNGFGFEEWLFNKSFVFKDENEKQWNFGYIEGIHKNYKQGDEKKPLQLFTINAQNKKRYIVAEIREWQEITQNESSDIILHNKHLITQMLSDLKGINNRKALVGFNEHQENRGNKQLFNIIFREVKYCYDVNNPLPKNNRIYKLNRFFLYR
jgi:hypothetical protein